MKGKLLLFVFCLFLLSGCDVTSELLETSGGPPPKNIGSNTDLEVNSLAVGTPNSTEGTDGVALLHQIEDDGGATSTGFRILVPYNDETATTEDTGFKIEVVAAGSACIAYDNATQTGAPTYTPCTNCITWADRATWDPASKGSGGAYAVWWDGDSWEAIDGQAD